MKWSHVVSYLAFLSMLQPADVHGRIYNAKTGQPLPTVSVYIVELETGITTDEDGSFDLMDIEAGQYEIKARHIGFREDIRKITLKENAVLSVSFYLDPILLDFHGLSVTATRTQKEPIEYPGIVHSLSADQLKLQQQVRTVPELLRPVPGIMVQKTAHGQGSPYIRGFTGFRTLFLVDGIRLNNSVFREGPNQYWNTVDPYAAAAIEVNKGQGATLFGSDAIGGTVRLSTVSPDVTHDNIVPALNLLYRYSSAENSSILSTQATGRISKRLFYLGGFSLKSFGNLVAGGDTGEQEKTGYTELDWDIKFHYNLDDQTSLTLAHQSVDQADAWRTHKTIYGIEWEGTTHGSEKKRALDQYRTLSYLQLNLERDWPFADAVQFTISRHVQEEEQHRVKSSDNSDRQGIDVSTIGFQLQCTHRSDIGLITYGSDMYIDDVQSYLTKYNADGTINSIAIQGSVADDSEYTSLGLYLQDDFEINSFLNVILGLRYGKYSLSAGKSYDPEGIETSISFTNKWSTVIGSGKILYKPWENSNRLILFTGISQSYRAPNLSDLTRFDTARSNEIEIAVSDLDPEKFFTIETGCKSETEKLNLQASVYYTGITSMIVRVPTSDFYVDDSDTLIVVTKKNSGEGWVTGTEMSLRYRFTSQNQVFGMFSWVDGEVDTYPTSDPIKVREPLSRLMPMAMRAGYRWDSTCDRFWTEIAMEYYGEQDKLSSRDQGDTQRIPPGGTPGFTIFNLHIGSRLNRHISFAAAVENITDKDYRIHGSGLNEAGRNFMLTLEYKN